jgi:tetratricopeptide (TPR) repeat protein
MKDTTSARTPPEQSPARDLTEHEVARLGEFVWELVLRLDGRMLHAVMKEAQCFAFSFSQIHPDFLSLGQRIRDAYIDMGEPRACPTFQAGALVWEVLTEALYLLRDARKNRVTHIDGDGQYSAPPPPPDAVDLEYLAQYLIDGPSSERTASPTRPEQTARLRFALALDPFCAEAYCVQGELEEQAGMFHAARVAYEQAMKIAGLKIGPDAILSAEVRQARQLDFWYSSGGRAYMHSRASLAWLLWRKLDDLPGAIAHFQALLELEPGDHQGNRFALMCCLLQAGRDEELGSTLARNRFYTHDSGDVDGQHTEEIADTCWHYTHACWRFRTAFLPEQSELGLRQAHMALSRALQENPHVPGLLLSSERRVAPQGRSTGSLEEAAWYVDMAFLAWKNTPGALEWLAASVR